jgi:predicted transcriptional regulator
MTKRPKRLPDGELEIMQAVWTLEPPVSRAELEAVLKEHRNG